MIVIGGDGFMLQTLKRIKIKKYFYGINSGSYGFLMNKFSDKHILKYISKSKSINISPLEMTVKLRTKNIKSLAINEVSILRQSRQAANLSIRNNLKMLLRS